MAENNSRSRKRSTQATQQPNYPTPAPGTVEGTDVPSPPPGLSRENRALARRLRQVYETLRARYGAQNWWPHETKWEIMVGAILTQNTSWQNVEKALAQLKRAQVLT